MNTKIFALLFGVLMGSAPVSAQYAGWSRSGSLFLNTTPTGADLPDSVQVEEFPVLVRLHADFFDFSTAKPRGEDVRFSMAGRPLVYQVEDWNSAEGVASIWVRIPVVRGNARQELRMHWGRADAASESSGRAVFNASNGYVAVMHMGDGLEEEVGGFETKDVQTSGVSGLIGRARRLAGKQGVFCGEKNEHLPVGSSSHSTEVWMRADRSNGRVVGWGNEHAQGKVVMEFQSPPHVRMDCYFSRGNVEGGARVALGEWTHVVHTYRDGESRLYLNGVLDAENRKDGPPMAIKTPARMYLGGWYNNYDFVGDLDEVRVSSVHRSPEWIRLQYENQKPLQTLIGPLVQSGEEFAVTPARASVAEGGNVKFVLAAGGAQKVSWVLKSGAGERVVAVDRFSFTYEPGRVKGDQTVVLECRAVYAEGLRSVTVPVEVKETIADPEFALVGPTRWDGRSRLEVEAKMVSGEGQVVTEWNVGPLAVIKESVPGKLTLIRAQASGRLTVTATMSNGGSRISRSIDIEVKEPEHDTWVERVPEQEEKPVAGQFYARDGSGEGTLHYNGRLAVAADSVFLRLFADGKVVRTVTAKPDSEGRYALSVRLKPGLIKYRVQFGTGKDTVLDTVEDLVCGDAYLIDGQSNALATDTREQSPAETHDWIRSYAKPSLKAEENEGNLWVHPVWKAQKGERAELGWWGMELAKRLVESQKVPIFMVNAAVGGTRIDQHQRNAEEPADVTTIYGRMLWRVRGAKLTHGIRAILWHQGENDQGAAGPSGGYGWESYQSLFVEMAGGWKTDFPNVQNYYVFQIWPNACSMGGRQGSGDMLREKQRTLPMLFSRMSILSTLGVRPPGGCHYPLTGWAEFAGMVQPLIERDHYGRKVAEPLTAANLRRAVMRGARDTVELTFDQPVIWDEKLVGQFYLDGERASVVSGEVRGNVLTLRLSAPSGASRITYLREVDWSQDKLLMGANGLAALTFANVPLVVELGQ
jgi:hypothetical protein